jgi:RimJ/RimL family protein N-acetyltransferase
METNEILTERLRLRLPTLDDAEAIFDRYAQDPEVCRYLSWVPHRSIDDTRAFLIQIVEGNSTDERAGFLIFSRKTGQLLGSVGGVIDGTRMQFGYCLARDSWGQGFATEAAKPIVEMALGRPEIWRVQAFCDLENRASARVLEKAGLSREGTLRRYMRFPNLGDTPRDVFFFAKVRD